MNKHLDSLLFNADTVVKKKSQKNRGLILWCTVEQPAFKVGSIVVRLTLSHWCKLFFGFLEYDLEERKKKGDPGKICLAGVWSQISV